MKLTNSQNNFGIVTIVLHWAIALLTIVLFFLGIWLVELDYYDPWFQLAPWWHKGLGVVVMLLLLIRAVWKWLSINPESSAIIPQWQKNLAGVVHSLLDLLLFIICLTGYLIVTAKGHALSVFDMFSIPALGTVNNMADIAGEVHYILAYLMMILVLIHILAALKHHFINKDNTLDRMLGRK